MALLAVDRDRIAAAARRVMARCDELARVSATSGGIERVYLSPEHARVNRLAAEWMREVGMATRQDAAGNQLGRIAATAPASADAPALLLGSHLDTVPDAGRFDGIVGVLMALEVVRLLRAPGDGPARAGLPFALEVVAFSDEEGTRFGKALLGSSAVAGAWDDDWWTLTDADGTTLREAFLEFGLDPGRIGEAARRPAELVGYLEAHIEQGPELDRRGESLAVVSSIASARRFQLAVEGEARHAGGTPVRHAPRRAARRLARPRSPSSGSAAPSTTSSAPSASSRRSRARSTSCPARRGSQPRPARRVRRRARPRVGSRSRASSTRSWAAAACAGARARCTAPRPCCARRCCRTSCATASCRPSRRAPATRPSLFSPAGHDGMAIGAITDVGMLFLRNPDGISHHPDEAVSAGDVALGIQALAEAVLHLAAEPA